MNSPTPLVVLARVLALRRGEEPPSFSLEHEAEEVREYLRRSARTDRERAVVEYLIAAATGGARGTGFGSLKHLLWSFRNRMASLYPGLAEALLQRVLDESDLPLHEGLAWCLRDDPALGTWVQQVLEGPSKEDLAGLLAWERIGGFLVAFNPTHSNLAKVAFSREADLYVAASSGSAVLMSRQRKQDGSPIVPPETLDAIAREAGGEWASPYGNLRVARKDAPDFQTLSRAVRLVLGRSKQGPP